MFRLQRLRYLRASDYPAVDANRFLVWQTAQINAVRWYVWVTIGNFVYQVGLVIVSLVLFPELAEDDFLIFPNSAASALVLFAPFIIGLTIAALKGSRAKKLRRAEKIMWP